MQLSYPYGVSAPDPYWGLQTSAVNFCEDDYIVIRYVAEFFNTLTSLLYIAYGVHGLQRYKRQDIRLLDSVNWPYWGLIGVGIFSGLYHTTLKYYTQMSDELSMHMAIGTVLNQVFNFDQAAPVRRRNTSIILGVLVPFYIYHCITDEFALHVILFLSMCIIVTVKTNQVIKQRIKDDAHRRRLLRLARFATVCALTAYGIWNIDVNFCPTVRSFKHQLGLPWGIVLELHGWWHIMTAIAAYTFMAVIEFLTSPEEYESHGVGFAWPAKKVLQDLVPKRALKSQTNGYMASGHTTNSHLANGHIRKSD